MVRTDNEKNGVDTRRFPPPPAMVVIGPINPYPERGEPRIEEAGEAVVEDDEGSRKTIPIIRQKD